MKSTLKFHPETYYLIKAKYGIEYCFFIFPGIGIFTFKLKYK